MFHSNGLLRKTLIYKNEKRFLEHHFTDTGALEYTRFYNEDGTSQTWEYDDDEDENE